MTLEAIVEPDTGTIRIELAPEVRLGRILEELSRNIGGTRSVTIGDSQGLPVAAVDRTGNSMAATAMATLALNSARAICANLDLPDLCDVTIEGRGWKVFVHYLGPSFTLFIVTAGDVDPAFVKVEIERHVPELHEILVQMG